MSIKTISHLDVEYREIDYAPGYFVSRYGDVYSAFTDRLLKIGPNAQVSINVSGKNVKRGSKKLAMRMWGYGFVDLESGVHPKLTTDGRVIFDNIEWRRIPDFPNYVISKCGRVLNVLAKRELKRIMNKRGGTGHYSLRRDMQTVDVTVGTMVGRVWGND